MIAVQLFQLRIYGAKKNGTFNFFFGIELEMCNGMGMGMHSKKTMWFYERKKATHSKGLLY